MRGTSTCAGDEITVWGGRSYAPNIGQNWNVLQVPQIGQDCE